MKIHPQVSQTNGIITVMLQATFVGDVNDANDRKLIAALGDPKVNLTGTTLTDPGNLAFTFQFPSTDYWVGVTTQMVSTPVRFMVALPPVPQGQPAPTQGQLDCITPNPAEAAQAWVTIMVQRIVQAMTALRTQIPVPIIADSTV